MGMQSIWEVTFYCMCGHSEVWSRTYNPQGEAPKPPKTITCCKCNEQMLQSWKDTELQRNLAEMYKHW